MSTYSGHIRLLVILVLFLALLTIASIILSVVSITSWGKKDNGPKDYDHYKNYYYNNYGKDSKDKSPYNPYPYPYPQPGNNGQSPVVITNSIRDSTSSAKGKDCYTIAFGGDWYNHEFIDEADKCALKGWGPAIVLAACEAAGIKCKIVYTPYEHCINYFDKDDYASQPILGTGLYYDAIDGCGGWFPEQERYNVAGFTDGWIRNPKVYLWYKQGSAAPTGSNLRIGYPYSAPWNEKCLKRYLSRLGISGADLIPYGGDGGVNDALQADSIDLGFLSDLNAGVDGGFNNVVNRNPNDPMRCAEGEAGIATRKCSIEFIYKFNKGLNDIKHNGVLNELCTDALRTGPDKNDNWCAPTIRA